MQEFLAAIAKRPEEALLGLILLIVLAVVMGLLWHALQAPPLP